MVVVDSGHGVFHQFLNNDGVAVAEQRRRDELRRDENSLTKWGGLHAAAAEFHPTVMNWAAEAGAALQTGAVE